MYAHNKKIIAILGIVALFTAMLFMSLYNNAEKAEAQLGSDPRVLRPSQGGTGLGSAVAGDVGTCIKVLDDSPLTYEFGTCGSSGGFSTTSADYWKTLRNFFSTSSADYWETQQAPRGTGGNSKWATSTNGLTIYPNTATAVVIGASATSTSGAALEVTGLSRFSVNNDASNPVISGLTDTNTGIEWSGSDVLRLVTGGLTRIRIPGSTGNDLTLNTDGVDMNTLILGNSSVRVLQVDGGNNRVGILTSATPANIKNALDVNGAVVIGNAHAETDTAPSNGLLVQGTVGIGTSSPYAKLSVVGQTVAEYFTATSTSATSTLPKLVTSGVFQMGSDIFTDLTGSGLTNTGNVLTLDRTGDWTGTFDGFEGSYYFANSYSTSSADYWKTQRNFWSTSSADYWETQQAARGGSGGSWATSSSDFWLTTKVNPLTVGNIVATSTTATSTFRALQITGVNDVLVPFIVKAGPSASTFNNMAEFRDETGAVAAAFDWGGTLDLGQGLTASSPIAQVGTVGGLSITPQGRLDISHDTGDLETWTKISGSVLARIRSAGSGSVLEINPRAANDAGILMNASGLGGNFLDFYGPPDYNSVFSVSENGTTTATRIIATERVGIGTTSPYAKLSVVGQTVAEYFTATSTAATSTLPNLTVSNGLSLFGTFGDALSDFCTAITGGSGLCDGDDATGGGSGSGVGTVATSSQETAGHVPYFTTTNGYPARLSSVATSSVTISSPLSSGGTAGFVVGGSGWTLGITADGIGDTQLAFNTGQHLTTTSDVTFNKITVTGTATSTIQGSVGIGTSSPTYSKLTVRQDTNTHPVAVFSNNTAALTNYLMFENTGGFAGGEPAIEWRNIEGACSTARLRSKPGAGYAESQFAIDVGNASCALTERLVIDKDGKVDFSGASVLDIPSNATTDANGEITLDDTSGQLRGFAGGAQRTYAPFVTITAGHATSSWSGTTTQYIAPAIAAGTIVNAYCETDTGTVGVSLYDGTNRANYIPTASTTKNLFTFSTNHTFTAGESMRVDFGNPASSPKQVACRFRFTYDAD